MQQYQFVVFLTFLVICGHWTITYTNDESECCDGDEKDYIGDNHDTQYEQGVPRRIHETIKSLILKDATLWNGHIPKTFMGDGFLIVVYQIL